MTISISVEGISGVKRFLESKSKEALVQANKAIMKAGFFIESEVKDSIAGHRAEPKSVDTGRFLNSVKNVQNNPLTATIESNVEHAQFLEYGTSRMHARSHFRNTAKRNEKKVSIFVNDEIRKISN